MIQCKKCKTKCKLGVITKDESKKCVQCECMKCEFEMCKNYYEYLYKKYSMQFDSIHTRQFIIKFAKERHDYIEKMIKKTIDEVREFDN